MDLTKLHLHWGESRYKGKTYRSYSLARTYRQDKKNRKEIVLQLGKLSDEEAARWHNLLEALKKTIPLSPPSMTSLSWNISLT